MIRRVLAPALLILLAACATPNNTRYSALSGGSASVAQQAASATDYRAADYRVAIGPVTVPDALDRLQIVLTVAPNRQAILDAENWSAPLKRQIPRVIAEVVGQRLPAARVAGYTQYGGQDADFGVLIDVTKFESVAGESIALEARWTVRDRAGGRLREARSVLVERVDAPGVAPLVRAHGKALVVLGEEIAAAIAPLAHAK